MGYNQKMPYQQIYVVVISKWDGNFDNDEDSLMLHFTSLKAVAENLPGIIYSRLMDLHEGIEDSGRTVEDVVAYLSASQNMLKCLTFSNGMSVVCGYETLYI